PSGLLAGSHSLALQDAAGNTTATSNFSVAPKITSISPTSGVVGASLTAAGNGFAATSAIQSSVDGGAFVALSGCTSTSSGTVSCSFTIPTATNGSHTLAFKDAAGNQSSTSTFSVTAQITSIAP